jgi:hypothetical protein
VKKGTVALGESELGRIAITTDTVAAIAGRAVDESFGVVDQAGRRGPLRLLRRGRHDRGVRVRETDGGLALELQHRDAFRMQLDRGDRRTVDYRRSFFGIR